MSPVSPVRWCVFLRRSPFRSYYKYTHAHALQTAHLSYHAIRRIVHRILKKSPKCARLSITIYIYSINQTYMYIYVCLQVRCIVLSTITNVSSVNVVSLCIHMTCMNININIILINAGSGFFCVFFLFIYNIY